MPQIKEVDGKAIKPYGVGANTNQKLFLERLSDRFKPHEYVKVINVDDEAFIWQYMPAEKEEEQFTPDGMHRHIYREDPEVWMLDPGESETIIGACAYLMIEGLYKKLMSKKVMSVPNPNPAIARKFNFADPAQAEYWIDHILVGKEVPSFAPVATTNLPEGGESYEPKRGPGRPVNQTV